MKINLKHYSPRYFHKCLTILLCISCIAGTYNFGSARPAKKGTITLQQPDGSEFRARLIGDEFLHLTVTEDGRAVSKEDDGWYYYIGYDINGNGINTGIRVGEKQATIPSSLSLAVPYERLSQIAAERRRNTPQNLNGNLIQRLNSKNNVSIETKATSSPVVKHGLVILVEFQDLSFRFTKADFENLLKQKGYSYNGATGCAKEYFDSQFDGMYDFQFDVTDIVKVSQKFSYYGKNVNDEDQRPEIMVEEACKLADAFVDFSKYDDDGDGYVDNVFIFYAGADEAEGASSDAIWSHAWYLESGAGRKLTLDGKKIDSYACTSELTCGSGSSFKYMAPIGTFCHEYSHTFGLPDLYDTDYTDNGESNGVWGSTSLMDAGNMNNDGNTPPYYNAMERCMLGLSNSLPLPSGTFELTPLYKNGQCYTLESGKKGEYYLFECRDNSGWDKYTGGAGMLVYHVDKSNNVVSRGMTAAQLWDSYNMVNAFSSHPCMEILKANPNATSVKQVFYPYNTYNSITPDTKSKLKFWSGEISEISIIDIKTESNGNVSMTIPGGTTSAPPVAENIEYDIYQNSAIINFTSSYPFDGEADIEYGFSGSSKLESIRVKAYESGKYAFKLEGLDSRSSYTVNISFTLDDVTGEKSVVKFLTASTQELSFPYIYLKNIKRNSDGTFPRDSKLPLELGGLNNREDIDHIVWYYKGKEIHAASDYYYHPESSGELTAEIIYNNGNHEFISRQITVK